MELLLTQVIIPLIQSLQAKGGPFLVLLTLFVAMGFLYLLARWWSLPTKQLGYLFLKRFGIDIPEPKQPAQAVVTQASLQSHVSFRRLDELIESLPNRMSFTCPLRRAIFVALLTLKFRVLYKALQMLVKSTALDDQTNYDFYTVVRKHLDDALYLWRQDAAIDGIPAVAIDKFSQVTQDISEAMHNLIKEQVMAMDNNQGSTNSEKLGLLLNVIVSAEWCFLPVLRKTLSDMNGELSETQYKGQRCIQCKDSCPYKHKPRENVDYTRTVSDVSRNNFL